MICNACNGTGISVCYNCRNSKETKCDICRKDLGTFECEECEGTGEMYEEIKNDLLDFHGRY